MKKPSLYSAFRLLFVGLIVVFLIVYMKNIDYDSLTGLSFELIPVLIAIVFALSFRFWGSFVWAKALEYIGDKPVPINHELVSVYATAWVGRYIPGKVTWILGKVIFSKKLGLSRAEVAISSVVEAVLQVVTLIAVSLVVIGFDARLDVVSGGYKLLIVAAAIGLTISIHPRIFNRLIKLAYKSMKKDWLTALPSISWGVIYKVSTLYLGGFVLSGASYFFFTKSLYPELGYNELLYIMSAFNLAGAIGMLAIFVPSGLGVREGVQFLLLSAIIPNDIALIITIAARIFSLIIDVGFWLISQIGRHSLKLKPS